MIEADATRGRDAAAYDALWSSVAVLDDHGVIVATNLSWSTFATLNGGLPASTGVGVDYIDVCERSGAHSVAHGLRSILSGECAHFDISYSSPSPLEDRWFVVQAARLATGVLVTHTNITGQMLMNDIADFTVDDDPVTRLPTLARGLRLIDAALQESATTGVRLMVATIRLLDLADIALSHGRLARDEIVVQVVARARRLMRVDDFLVRSGPAALMWIDRRRAVPQPVDRAQPPGRGLSNPRRPLAARPHRTAAPSGVSPLGDRHVALVTRGARRRSRSRVACEPTRPHATRRPPTVRRHLIER